MNHKLSNSACWYKFLRTIGIGFGYYEIKLDRISHGAGKLGGQKAWKLESLKATESEMRDDGVLLRYKGNELIGITILEASKR